MSFSESGGLTGWQKIGCTAYFILALFVCYFSLIFVAFDGWDEPPMPRWQSLLLFPGLPFIALAGGVLLIKYFLRDKK